MKLERTMSHLRPRTIAIAIALVGLTLAACQSVPTRHPTVVQAEQTYRQVSADQRIARNASAELAEARDALARAEAAWQRNYNAAETAHLAYLAEQRARVAAEVGQRRAAEEDLQRAGAEREQVRIQARERELARERERAAQAERQAQLSGTQTQQQMEQARAAAEAERQRAMQAQQQAALAQQQAEQARRAAEQARQRSAQLEADLQQMNAKNTERGMVVTLPDVLFDVGRAELRGGALRALDRLAEVLKKNPDRKVRIEGFTDSTGSEELNMQLSERRAAAVRAALVQRGVPFDRVELRPYGQAYPVASNDTPAGRQLNRRVEIVLSDTSGRVQER